MMVQEEKPKSRFPKKERLKSRKAIEELFKSGQKISSFPILMLYRKTNREENISVKTGVSVSKRKVRKAVNRNRIKRLMREAYRLNKHPLHSQLEKSEGIQLDVMFIYVNSEKPDYRMVETKIIHLLERLMKDLKQ